MESRFTVAQAMVASTMIFCASILLTVVGALYVDRMPVSVSPGTISVTGEGKVTASPDIAEMSFGVATGPQTTAKIASDKVAADMQKILAAVKGLGIEDKDISTENFYLNPVYDWTDGRQRLRGYEATQSLRVKVRDLSKVGDVLTAATDNGANQAGGVSFTLEDPAAKQQEAREEAIADAKSKAEKLAAQLGQRLGDVQSFNENGGGWYPPVMYEASRDMYGVGGAMSADAKAPVPLPAGDQDVSVTVNVTYELR